MPETFENIPSPSSENITATELLQMAAEVGEAAEDKVDHSYDSLPMLDPQETDPVSPELDKAMTEAALAREYDVRFNLDQLIENCHLTEADSPRTIAFINWANSKNDDSEVNWGQWVADGMENNPNQALVFKNKNNFASAKSNTKGRWGDATRGSVINNVVTSAPVANVPPKQPEQLDDETQALLDKFIQIKKSSDATQISAGDRVDNTFIKLEKNMKNFILGRLPTPLIILAGAPGVGKTYTFEKVVDQFLGANAFEELQAKGSKPIPNSNFRLVWKTQAGGGEEKLLLTLFMYRKNCALVFNDCDVWLSKSSKAATNILKNAFEHKNSYIQVDDPDKGGKKSEIVRYRNAELKGEQEFDENVSLDISIDMQELRENSVLKYYIGDELVCDKVIPMSEACEMLKTFGEKPNFKFLNESWAQNLKEASIFDSAFDPDQDDDEDIDTDNSAPVNNTTSFDSEYVDERYDDNNVVVRIKKFAFNGRVMFITNKHRDEIDSAIFDRAVGSMDIQLTPTQYLARLAQIKDKIKIGFENVDPAIENWARKEAYGLTQMLLSLSEKNVQVDGKSIVVSPDALTFRTFKNTCAELITQAETWLEDPARTGCSTLDDCIANKTFSTLVFERVSDIVAGIV